jgi:hypothetical protein
MATQQAECTSTAKQKNNFVRANMDTPNGPMIVALHEHWGEGVKKLVAHDHCPSTTGSEARVEAQPWIGIHGVVSFGEANLAVSASHASYTKAGSTSATRTGLCKPPGNFPAEKSEWMCYGIPLRPQKSSQKILYIPHSFGGPHGRVFGPKRQTLHRGSKTKRRSQTYPKTFLDCLGPCRYSNNSSKEKAGLKPQQTPRPPPHHA